jgi:hypothetical protein
MIHRWRSGRGAGSTSRGRRLLGALRTCLDDHLLIDRSAPVQRTRANLPLQKLTSDWLQRLNGQADGGGEMKGWIATISARAALSTLPVHAFAHGYDAGDAALGG